MLRISRSAEVRLLEAAEEGLWVTVVLRDGLTLQGCALYNPFRDTIALINPIQETRHDFSCRDVWEVKVGGDPRCIDLTGENAGTPRLSATHARGFHPSDDGGNGNGAHHA